MKKEIEPAPLKCQDFVVALKRKHFLRTGLIGIPAALLASVGYMRFFESGWFELTHKTIPLRGLTGPIRLLHLSDLHASPDFPLSLIQKAIQLGLGAQPDLCFITGDFVTLSEDFPNPEAYIETLRPLAEACPTLASLGNHDGGPWTHAGGRYPERSNIFKIVTQAGCRLLMNESESLTVKNQTIRVVGLGDLWLADLRPGSVLSPIASRNDEPTTLVLSHNPDSKTPLKGYAWDLICSGHTHGGQLVFPLLGWRPFLPVQDKSYPEGILQWDDRFIHITRGVGSILGMRINCRPEVSILNLVPA